MSIIDPRGFNNVIEWADLMTGQLGLFSDLDLGLDPNYERLDDPSEWQEWAAGAFGDAAGESPTAPDPFDYDDWREWAERLFATSNFTG